MSFRSSSRLSRPFCQRRLHLKLRRLSRPSSRSPGAGTGPRKTWPRRGAAVGADFQWDLSTCCPRSAHVTGAWELHQFPHAAVNTGPARGNPAPSRSRTALRLPATAGASGTPGTATCPAGHSTHLGHTAPTRGTQHPPAGHSSPPGHTAPPCGTHGVSRARGGVPVTEGSLSRRRPRGSAPAEAEVTQGQEVSGGVNWTEPSPGLVLGPRLDAHTEAGHGSIPPLLPPGKNTFSAPRPVPSVRAKLSVGLSPSVGAPASPRSEVYLTLSSRASSRSTPHLLHPPAPAGDAEVQGHWLRGWGSPPRLFVCRSEKLTLEGAPWTFPLDATNLHRSFDLRTIFFRCGFAELWVTLGTGTLWPRT